MFKNTIHEWGSIAKFLHWTVVLLIAVEVPVGFLMSFTYGMSFHNQDGATLNTLMAQIHHTIGFTILALVLFRILWRIRNVMPIVQNLSRFQNTLARLTHYCLYTLLLVLPFSGWSALSVFRGAPIWLFNRSDIIPPILPKLALHDTFGYGFFSHLHAWAYKIGALLLILHIGAALWHHFMARDAIFTRMWILGRHTR